MSIDFDPEKNALNMRKHGISLARAADFEVIAVLEDTRQDYGEQRWRAWGLIDGSYHCLAFTIRDGRTRAISLRRAHTKEIDRYGR